MSDIATIRLERTSDEEVAMKVELAEWLDVISPKEAHKLLKVALDDFEAAAMPYYIRSQGPEGDT